MITDQKIGIISVLLKTYPLLIVTYLCLIKSTSTLAQGWSGYYVDIQSDTIPCEFLINLSKVKASQINPLVFKKSIKVSDAQGVKLFKPYQLKSFSLGINQDSIQTYVPKYIKGEHIFLEVLEYGFIDIYKEYLLNPYDGSTRYELLIQVKAKPLLRVKRKGFKKQLMKYLGTPEYLDNHIHRKTKYLSLIEILKKYNDGFK